MMAKFHGASRARMLMAFAWCAWGALAWPGCGVDREAESPASDAAGRRDAATVSDPRIDASVPLDSSVLRDGAPLGRDASSDAGQRSDAAPRLSEIVETYFTNSCVLGRCHTTLSPQGDLALTGRRVGVHEVLVNARSSALPNRIRVVPYDPDASYLLEKLESDTPEVGTRMPPSAVPETEQIARVRAWILAGAPND